MMKGTFKMKNDSKYRIVVLAAAAMAASVVSAMPTKNDLAKAQPLVNELMGPLVNSFRAKKTKASEVGAKAEEYAREAETEAAKFLLLKGAITYYSHAEEYDKAADAVDELGRAVKDIPPDTMLDIISRATSRIGEANAPRLYAQYRLVSARSQAEKMVAKMKALAAKRPADDTVRRRYAEALAASGNWSAALDEFAKAKGKPGEIAAAEKSGKGKPGDIAEFWWGYEPEEQYASEAIKRHAAEFYKKALADGSISGLKKTLAEKRVASLGPVVESGAASAAAAPASEPAKPAVAEIKPEPKRTEVASKPAPVVAKGGKWTLPKTFQTPLERSLDLGDGVTMPFCACPAGSFTMLGHKVTITRPFWFTKTPVTLKQHLALPIHSYINYDDARKVDKEFKDKTIIVVSFNHEQTPLALNKKYKSILPPGYVFRFATEAEFYYAYRAGDGEFDATVDSEAVIRAKDAFREHGLIPEGRNGIDWARFPELPAPNAFGVIPWKGAATMFPVLDQIDVKGSWRGDKINDVMHYASEEIDPLRKTGQYWLFGADTRNFRQSGQGNWGCLWLVIGPDLEAEKKAAKK